MSKISLLVAEIGSTTTVINGFDFSGSEPIFIGQGQAFTSVEDGDVNIGVNNAIEDFKKNAGFDSLEWDQLIATSSAAGGLKMTVHGLVYDMTVKAAKEAALGAGANIKFITSGKLRRTDLKKIEEIQPNIILIAGGIDYGERDTAIENAEKIAQLDIKAPIIYAGNIENDEEIKLIFEEAGMEIYIVDNVYPRIDQLNIEPTRAVIQDVFERHIIHAPGMEKITELVNGSIMPTPGAVMEASRLLYEELGDLMTIDVGGATTDVHSVAEVSEEIQRILISPEPKAKRSVEGDLGCYVSMPNVVEFIGKENIAEKMNVSMEELEEIIEKHQPIPSTEIDIQFSEILAEYATITAVKRHAGTYRDMYGAEGKKTLAQGKDLTTVKYIIGTGGALSRLPNRIEMMKKIARSNSGHELLPTKEAEILVDNDYIMASLGVMSRQHPEQALALLKKSIGI
ncbi:glutamate mutase L [Peptoniphilus sp. KCTC 25270]|uniref:GlmL-related ornithine degradation protein n=1 Tax=Peptoniphilus sp. KCTC 25270 TaxID=2897414 RepID=UPI001E49D2F5|nr:GlmL-related ornithine degradation protein [Peptoniphilus sp. KCTC 25270]MCD1147061.1 glutamate mutase L [Peptoniphilus sp. KCTC 25270]